MVPAPTTPTEPIPTIIGSPAQGCVAGQDSEGTIVDCLDHTKVPFVKGKDVGHAMSPRENDQRRIGESQAEVRVSIEDLVRLRDVAAIEALQSIGPGGGLAQER